jgi:hypothetical protein
MPPNRKAHTEITEVIASLREFVTTSKFPTLTTEPTEANHESAPPTKTPDDGSGSYWAWPMDPSLEETQQEEKILTLFSADHITANLVVAASKHLVVGTGAPLKSDESNDSDKYWCMRPVRHDVVQNDLTSALHMESNLVQEAHARATTMERTPVVVVGGENNEEANAMLYWEWPGWQQKEKALQQLRQEEQDRQLLSLDHLEKMLLAEQSGSCHAAAAAAPLSQPPHAAASSYDYWGF